MSVLRLQFQPRSINKSATRFNSSRLGFRFLSVLCAALLLAGCASSKKGTSEEELASQKVEDLYLKAKTALDKGNYNFAIRNYQLLEASFPYGEFTEQAKLDMIFAFDKAGQAQKAVEAADNFIKLYPTHKNVDYAYYMKGVASFEKKQSSVDKFIKGGDDAIRDPKPYRDSQKAFEELIKRYPNSVYAADAQQRIVFVRNALAQRELAIAQFYFDNQTYVATVNRCKNIIYAFETSPAVEGALVLMEKAYVEMGLDDLAASTHEVLLENFPNNQKSPYKKKKGFFSKLNPFSE
ncbi:outer membrane protein assembly factor BamD [Arenicella xantha]|uniref:Outer membrane protein assembly factor BamD n=1 Tax=Arenicella xantha TaxID=644221 RepID=A0A395JFP1_9GAMM|nr:outer membrane protein assembly factor BamD [Arenicella xantha]RBP48477.1 Beta-barrel assembly machine subunit BamD [Arenicella xantha]